MNTKPLSDAQIKQFDEDGYIICKGYYDAEEMNLLLKTARADHNMLDHNIPIKDAQGRQSKLSLWNHPGDDIYGMISRGHRMVDASEQLLRDEVYHYHSKMMLKEPKVGGAWEWHQDYGYWYDYGCLVPSMLSCLIAVDRATKENGCLQVLSGSHSMGRINHDRINEQTMANPEHVEAALVRFPLVYLELAPGDSVFFDCNLLHRSDANRSDHRRWNYIASYNTAANQPYKRVRDYGNYEPLMQVPTNAIRTFASQHNL